MSQSESGTIRKQRWYNRGVFPLVPVIEIKKADEYNTRGFVFRWLFFTIWSLDHPEFEVSLVASTHWGIGLVGVLFYLRWVITIPCTDKVAIWIYRNIDRKPRYRDGNKS